MTSWSACGTILGSRATTLDALLQGDKMAKTEPKIIKFNSFDKAQRYITELGYSLKQSNQFKEDRSFVYQKKRTKNFIYMRSTFDYLNTNTLEMGTVWTIQQF